VITSVANHLHRLSWSTTCELPHILWSNQLPALIQKSRLLPLHASSGTKVESGINEPMRSLKIGAYLAGCLLLASALTGRASALAQDQITIDARTPPPAPKPSSYRGGTLTSSSGHIIGINSSYLTMDSRPWLPVMGEFHYSRVPESEWEEELLKMKSAGVQIVSTYVIWIHHEEVEGQFDWSGQKGPQAFCRALRQARPLYHRPHWPVDTWRSQKWRPS
jgi:hypothetical protein